MKAMYASRPLDDAELHEPELDDLPTYSTPASAVLTHQSAIPTLAEFCQLIRFDAFTPLQKPVYTVSDVGEALWQAELKVPKIKALNGRSLFVSDVMPTKKSAKQRAAFDACILLHRAGALDDHLLPFREPTGVTAKDADGHEVNRVVVPRSVEIKLPNVFGNAWGDATWLHVVEISPPDGKVFRLGLVCGSSSPSEVAGRLFGQDGKTIAVRVATSTQLSFASIEERDRRLFQLQEFQQIVVRVLLNRRIGSDRFYSMWTPLTTGGDVDWPLIETTFSPLDLATVKSGDLVVVPFSRPSARIGTFSRTRKDVDTSSPSLDVEIEPPQKKRKMMER
jgi:endoribonuclease Dicer